jgi:hypothetical protein
LSEIQQEQVSMPVNQRQLPHSDMQCTIGGALHIQTTRHHASSRISILSRRIKSHLGKGGDSADLPWRLQSILGGDFNR